MKIEFDQMCTFAAQRTELSMKDEVVDGIPFTIFSYHIQLADTFDDPIAKEFRGTTFRTDTKELVSRPFPKFFNLGEREETQTDNIDWKNALYYEKLDGSMAVPVLIGGKVFWKTKKSFYSDVAKQIQDYYDNRMSEHERESIQSTVYACDDVGYTPIYEYIGPQNRIVLKYPSEALWLLGSRCNETGELSLNMALVKNKPSNVTEEVDHEGYVVYDGKTLFKMKTKWYVERHRIMGDISDKAIIQAALEGRTDDILGLCAELGMCYEYDRIKYIADRVGAVWNSAHTEAVVCFNSLKHITDKKEFALTLKKVAPAHTAPIVFSMSNGKSYNSILDNYVWQTLYKRGKLVF